MSLQKCKNKMRKNNDIKMMIWLLLKWVWKPKNKDIKILLVYQVRIKLFKTLRCFLIHFVENEQINTKNLKF
jgi:hypothetical protein